MMKNDIYEEGSCEEYVRKTMIEKSDKKER